MKKKILMIFAILVFFACQTSATSVLIDNVEISPAYPTNNDSITININGRAGWPFEIVSDNFSQNGTSLQLDFYFSQGIAAMISHWNYSKQIQPLASGTYSLNIKAYDNYDCSLGGSYNKDFNVIPEPATVVLLGFGLIFTKKKFLN